MGEDEEDYYGEEEEGGYNDVGEEGAYNDLGEEEGTFNDLGEVEGEYEENEGAEEQGKYDIKFIHYRNVDKMCKVLFHFFLS